PEILIYPKTYIAGEETFYVEGRALPDSTVIVFFKKKGTEDVKIRELSSNSNGGWSFSTEDLFKSGDYFLSARTKDKRGAISDSSPEYKVKVILSGVSIGPWIFTYQFLFLILLILIILIAIFIIFIILSKIRRSKDRLREETEEAAESLKKTFDNLKKEIEKKVRYFDKKPGLSKKERKLRDELIVLLKDSEKVVGKEIKDIEKELK
ncbi:hypothetical protein ACFL11_01565, partial [Patescibacteria group bacterium]